MEVKNLDFACFFLLPVSRGWGGDWKILILHILLLLHVGVADFQPQSHVFGPRITFIIATGWLAVFVCPSRYESRKRWELNFF